MVPSKGGGDVPSSLGHLLLIDEESPVEPDIQDHRDMHPPRTITPILRACECKICEKPSTPAPQTPAQEIVSDDQVEPPPR